MLPLIRLDLYKTASMEAKTLQACGWSRSEISLRDLYSRLIESDLNGNGQEIPTEKEFRKYEQECREKGIGPY